MKHLTMTLITLCLVALLLGACVPAPVATPAPVVSPVDGPSAPAGEWQTYTDAEVGFSLQTPANWSSEALPDQTPTLHGRAFTGPEGAVEVYWGAGFGGGCPQGTEPVQFAQGEVPACHSTMPDGTEDWEQMYYQVEGGKSFAVRAYTSNTEPASDDLVLQVLSTLTFMQPAGSGWQTYTDAEAGYSIQTPQNWESAAQPDQNDGAIHGRSFIGPEGGVEVYWGVGFGGACPGGTEPVQLAQGAVPACHATQADGTEVWSQIGYEVSGGNSFSVRAYTSDAGPSSHDLVLQVLATLTFMPPAQPHTGVDPLPSWNPGPAKTAILKFVADVTDPTGPAYVPPADRVAVSDNDGTLWTEKPIPAQAAFIFARIIEMAPDHPEWKTTQPYQAVLEGDTETLATLSPEDVEKLVFTTSAGMTEEEFEAIAKAFLDTAKHPRFGVFHTQTVYQPMLELLAFLRANGFRTFIVSGGGVEFMRVFSEEVYGIPRENVVGSSLQYEFQQTPDGSVLIRQPEMVSFDDRAMKPVNIQLHIGRRPILAIGNSDGDLAMFQYTDSRKGPFLNVLVVHDDAEREYDYLTGTDEVMTAAAQSPWMFVSMKKDFKTVFPGATQTQIANPASQNCIKQGGTLTIEERGDGGQFGACTFEDNLQSPAGDGSQCEEWAMMRGDCPVGGVKVTGYVTPAATYCAITGGTYAVTGNSGQADEQGTCTLPGGVQCDATEFYNGKCDASTGKMPNTSGLTLMPPAVEVCNGMAQALSEALSRANTQHAIVEVSQPAEPVPMIDPSTGAEGTACRAQAAGTGEDFASPDAIMNEISAVLTGGGWQEDKRSMGAGGPTGEGWGFRSGDLVVMALAAWLPDPAANCPKDRPIPECKVTPGQQLYTITLDTAQTVKQAPVVQGVQAAPAPKSNPAATNCINVGGTPKTETRPDGGQYGVCYFGDNYVCEEWALLHGECPVGGVKVTGYNTPAARYCAITGGQYVPIGTTNTGQEAGSCTLPSGKVCDADEYYTGACSSSSPEPAPPTAVPPIGKPNPASQYCASVGGTLKIEQRDDVGQIGVCYFADNKQCEEWALERGYCPVGGVKVTGYNTPAARYCAITGGKYSPTGTTPDGQEDGNCALPNGEICGAWQYYNGYCGTTF